MKIDKKYRKILIRYFFLAFFSIALVYIIGFSIIQTNTIGIIKNEIKQNERTIVSIQEEILDTDFNEIISDLLNNADRFKIRDCNIYYQIIFFL